MCVICRSNPQHFTPEITSFGLANANVTAGYDNATANLYADHYFNADADSHARAYDAANAHLAGVGA